MVAVHNLQAAHPLDKAAFTLLDDASRTACDALDGVEDGVINDPRMCEVDVDALICADAEDENCLTAGQAETARFIYGDMVDEDGNLIAPGVPPGAEASGDWAFWLLANEAVGSIGDTLREMLTLIMRHEPGFDAEGFDPVRDRAQIVNALAPFDTMGDLGEFRDRGGKLLMYQGWNDFPLRPGRAFDYLAALDAANGGPERTADFFRLFMVPRHGALRRGPRALAGRLRGPDREVDGTGRSAGASRRDPPGRAGSHVPPESQRARGGLPRLYATPLRLPEARAVSRRGGPERREQLPLRRALTRGNDRARIPENELSRRRPRCPEPRRLSP